MRRPALGLPPRTVSLMPHDPRWAELFEFEALRIRDLCGVQVLAIEHIGSTAVRGIDAKPVIDMLIGIAELAQGEALLAKMQQLGYVHRTDDLMPGRLYAVRDDAGMRTHQAHICKAQGNHWRERVCFRDALRADAALAAAYMRLKHELARRHRNDRIAYASAKGDFVAAVLAKH